MSIPRAMSLLVLLCIVPGSFATGHPIDVIAFFGEPFGVARVELPVNRVVALDPDPRVVIRETSGRLLYPVTRKLTVRTGLNRREPRDEPRIGGGRLLSRIGDLLRDANAIAANRPTVGYEVFFLFTGKLPLHLEIDSPTVTKVTITPQVQHSAAALELRDQWWQAYQDQHQDRMDAGDYPAVMETYLTEMLASRMKLRLKPQEVPTTKSERWLSTLELLSGAERLQMETLRRSVIGDWPQPEVANLPLPSEPTWTPLPVADHPEAMRETLATRVPPECLYLRFGSYANYQWFQDLSEENGGDIVQLFALRGIDRSAAQRLQERLNLKTTELSRLFGPQVIEDIAIIGHDLMLDQGPAMGILFQAKNPLLLRTTLAADRQLLIAQNPRASLRIIEIGEQKVSLLDTPDHQIRSFWVDLDQWHLVTTSRHLAERFLEVAGGSPSLADSPEFGYARSRMPVESELTVFAYFSSDFFQNLVSPQYVIEMQRRMRASAEIAMIHLARAAARAETFAGDSQKELIRGGFLPPGFGDRPDGSGPILLADQVLDSMRGHRGSFVPIPDIRLETVTLTEADSYRDLAEYYSHDWRQMDPLVVGVRRKVESQGRERLEIRAEIAPLVPEKYGWLTKQLGPPTNVVVHFAPDDLIHVQAHVTTDLFGGTIPPHHLFAAVKDTEPPSAAALAGVVRTFFALRSVPGYLGAWPQPGALDRLPLGIGRGQPIGPNTSRLLGGIYRWQASGFSVLSLIPEILQSSVPHLQVTEDGASAQVRAHIGNLVGSQLEGWVNNELYQRNLQASLSGAGFLQSLTDQLRVPAEQTPEFAARVLSGKVSDPLGGEYALVADAVGLPSRWQSSSWPDEPRISAHAPADYVAPPMRWFRGMAGELTQFNDRLVLSAEVEMQRPPPDK